MQGAHLLVHLCISSDNNGFGTGQALRTLVVAMVVLDGELSVFLWDCGFLASRMYHFPIAPPVPEQGFCNAPLTTSELCGFELQDPSRPSAVAAVHL